MIRDRVIRWLGGIVPDPMATPECQHSWTNWSEPNAVTVTSMFSGTEREGWQQNRRCVKCNMHERRYA